MTYTGLEAIANEVDNSAPEIAYVVLQRPDGRHRNPEVARVRLDADSLAPFVPTISRVLPALPPESRFRRYVHGPLASALLAWLRTEMERHTQGETQVTFKVNLWGPKGSRLHRALRIEAVRVSSLTAAIHARYGDEPPAEQDGPAPDQRATEQLGYLFVALATHGMAVFHANVHRMRGEHELAEQALSAAEEAMRLALALGGYPDVALDGPGGTRLVLPFRSDRSSGPSDGTPPDDSAAA